MKAEETELVKPYSPSGASRWLKCPAGERLTIKSKTRKTPGSRYADEGTRAHGIAAELLAGKKNVTGPAEMLENGRAWAAELRAIAKKRKLKIAVEREVQWGAVRGTADAILYSSQRLYVFDYKYGAGVPVSIENNPQVLLYALGAIATLGIAPTEITIGIFQPRTPFGDAWQMQTIDATALQWFAANVEQVVEKIKGAGKLDYAPGEHCRWCPVLAQCPEQKKEMANMLKITDKKLSVAEIKRVLDAAPQIKYFLRAVEEQAREAALSGHDIDGYKLVESLGNREWIDPEAAKKKLKKFGKAIYETRLKSPSQVEKITGKTVIDALIERPSRGLVLAPEDDKRPAIAAGQYAKQLGFEVVK